MRFWGVPLLVSEPDVNTVPDKGPPQFDGEDTGLGVHVHRSYLADDALI